MAHAADRYFPAPETILPAFRLPTDQGEKTGSADLRQKRSGLFLFVPHPESEAGAAALAALSGRAEEIGEFDAAVLAIVAAGKEAAADFRQRLGIGFALLLDPDGRVTAKCLGRSGAAPPILMAVDRFGAIWDRIPIGKESAGRALDRAVQTLAFMTLQCPECGVPDRPPAFSRPFGRR